jgi:hypothetical protein
VKPLVEHIEDRKQALFGVGSSPRGSGLDEIARPALFAKIEERKNELVLGGKVPIERRLGDACALDDLIDADCTYAAP